MPLAFLLLLRSQLAQFHIQGGEVKEANVSQKNKKRKCKQFISVFSRKNLLVSPHHRLTIIRPPSPMMKEKKVAKQLITWTKKKR